MGHPLDYDLGNHSDFEQGRVWANETEFTVVVPVKVGMGMVEIQNTSDNSTLIEVNVSREIYAFCQDQTNDSECANIISEYEDLGITKDDIPVSQEEPFNPCAPAAFILGLFCLGMFFRSQGPAA
jgi:hypothetical protein